ncbi:MAG: DnaJ domain-containing protein [Deltaproteobacteria bacterium]|jgi:DnaJ-class molecular chaperone|nr:DnaJ domain-containing protein [Deltaproteobacteria bacterium]
MRAGRDKDFYSVLGLGPEADQETVRRAYLRLAQKHHPDRNPGDPKAEELFKSISQAYAVLRDPAARSRYDRKRRGALKKSQAGRKTSAAPKTAGPAAGRTGSSEPSQGAGGAFPGAGGPFQSPGGDSAGQSVDDIFQKHAGSRAGAKTDSGSAGAAGGGRPDDGGRESGGKPPGRTGPSKERAPESPKAPGGIRRLVKKIIGAIAGTVAPENPDDPGPGDIVLSLALSPEAAQNGATIDLDYLRDGGHRRLSVKIPPGVRDDSRLRLAGQGNPVGDGRNGDLVLTLSVVRP